MDTLEKTLDRGIANFATRRSEALHTWNIPYKAIEEALANAVYHKAYDIAEPITVTLTPESMEILSIPGPDRSITEEDLKRFHLVSKRYRNRRIGNFLKELQLADLLQSELSNAKANGGNV